MDLQTPKGGEAGLCAVAQYGGYRPSEEGRKDGSAGNLARHAGAGGIVPTAGARLPSSALALGVRRRPAPFSTRSDFPGGESQRGGERRGDRALGKPGRQEEEAPHPGLASGLGPPHGELPEGLGNPGSSPRRPCSGLTPVCRWTQRCDTGAPADVQPVPERNSFCCLVTKSCPTL